MSIDSARIYADYRAATAHVCEHGSNTERLRVALHAAEALDTLGVSLPDAARAEKYAIRLERIACVVHSIASQLNASSAVKQQKTA